MNPTMISGVQPCEMRSLQRYPAAQPTAPAEVKCTMVSIGAAPPRDHVVWSLFSLVYGNPFCLGLFALVYSIKSRDRKAVGDAEGARQHALTARRFNIAATIFISIVLVMFIVVCPIIRRLSSYHYHYIYNYHG